MRYNQLNWIIEFEWHSRNSITISSRPKVEDTLCHRRPWNEVTKKTTIGHSRCLLTCIYSLCYSCCECRYYICQSDIDSIEIHAQSRVGTVVMLSQAPYGFAVYDCAMEGSTLASMESIGKISTKSPLIILY